LVLLLERVEVGSTPALEPVAIEHTVGYWSTSSDPLLAGSSSSAVVSEEFDYLL
jgi:hypothetical protein